MYQKLIPILALLWCAGHAVAAEVTAQSLLYEVEEAGIDPYPSRILVSGDFLRLDDGDDSQGYTLFDRGSGVIYNVDLSDHMVLVINPPAVKLPEPPVPLALGEAKVPDSGLPAVGGVVPEHHRLLAGGRTCVEVFSAPGFLGEAVDLLKAFYERLADQHALVMMAYPEEATDPCDLAEHVYAPGRRYGYGLPLTVRSVAKTETLQSFDEAVTLDEALFRLPQGFREIAMPVPPLPEG